MAGFDLTFSPSKSVSTAWALADRNTKAQIYACHRRAIEVVLTYAEREVFHSRSGTNGVVQEDIEGVVAAAFTHWDSRAGDPQLHDHVVVANRARSVSDGTWRTLDSRGLFKSVVALSELHQGVLSDLLTEELGWGWDGRARRHSEQLRFEVTGVPEALMAEFSQRSAAIEVRKTVLIGEFVAAYGRQPTSVEVLDLRRRATLETRPAKEHHSLAEMTGGWRRRAEGYVGDDQVSWVAGTGGPQRPAALARRRPGRWHLGRRSGRGGAARGRASGHLQPGQRLGRGAPPAARGPLRLARRADRGRRAHG